MLNQLIDSLQAKFPPNRAAAAAMVVLLPFIATGAGFLAIWVPAHFPGLPVFTAAQLTAFGATAVGGILLAGITAGYQWLDGWQKHEAHQHQAAQAAVDREHELALAVARSEAPFVTMEALDQLKADGQSAPPGDSGAAAHPLDPKRTVPVPSPETPPDGFENTEPF